MGIEKKIRKRQPKTLLTLEEWCEDFSVQAAENVYRLFEAEQEKVGDANYRQMISLFIAGLVSAVVFRSLSHIPEHLKSEREKYKFAMDSFTDIKSRVQDAVASGFTGGMKGWSGQTVDYYCQVKVVPEPVNKGKPC